MRHARRRLAVFSAAVLAALAAVLALVIPAGIASAATGPAAETRVWAFSSAAQDHVRADRPVPAGERQGEPPACPFWVSGACVAPEAVNGVSVSAGSGAARAAGSVVRTLGPDESVSSVFQEMKQLTYETGQEHALVRLTSGEFQLQSGGQMGIDLSGNIDQVLAHTHPYGVDALGPSADDLGMLAALKQSMSVLLEHGQTILFGPEGTQVWR